MVDNKAKWGYTLELEHVISKAERNIVSLTETKAIVSEGFMFNKAYSRGP